MGDLTLDKKNDSYSAAHFYANAAKRGNPQAYFNLAYLVESDYRIDQNIWKMLRIGDNTKFALLQVLYERCRKSNDAYLPCTLALWRARLMTGIFKYPILVKVSFKEITSVVID